MQKRNIILASILGAVIIGTGAYVLQSDSSAPAQGPDSAKQAAGLLDHLASKMPGQEAPLPQWQDSKVTVINGHNVPPVPDSKINNATLLGVDSDNNGIRDDVDRYIADKFGNDPEMFGAAQTDYQVTFTAMRNPTKENLRAEDKFRACLTDNSVKAQIMFGKLSHMTELAINTSERGQAYARAFAGMPIHTRCTDVK